MQTKTTGKWAKSCRYCVYVFSLHHEMPDTSLAVFCWVKNTNTMHHYVIKIKWIYLLTNASLFKLYYIPFAPFNFRKGNSEEQGIPKNTFTFFHVLLHIKYRPDQVILRNLTRDWVRRVFVAKYPYMSLNTPVLVIRQNIVYSIELSVDGGSSRQ